MGVCRVRHPLDRRPEDPIFVDHLAAVPVDDLLPDLGRLARAQGCIYGSDCARLLRIDLGGARGFETHANPMKLLITGLNHKTAPVEVRERLAFEEKSLPGALDNLKQRPELLEGMILSTCNRVEVAVTADDQVDAEGAVERFLSEARSVERAWVTPYLYRHDGSAAIRHLFRVASSLDSMVVGEPQILGQLKTAYALAKERGAISGFL